MRPEVLTMRAFGSYGSQTTIRFDGLNQNLFLITGNTGAGKTTIFDAIVFALYGETGSSSNRKDGVVLQSQFAAYDQEPFVELTFTEMNGAEPETYTVRRVPRHLRVLKRGAGRGSGTREVTGSVALRMPDGTEYPAKETDKKLEDIVGLTKGQFMQIAMIAQGEFMELLRAKSDDKKVIFRKLFHADLFRKIEDELGNRKKEKEKEITVIRTACQTETAHVRVPEEYGNAAEVSRLKKQVMDGEMAVLDPFLEALEGLCAYLKSEQKKAGDLYRDAKTNQNEKRDAHTNAVNLAQIFAQLEAAQKELDRCEAQEAEIQEMRRLVERLRAAFEIQSEYRRFRDASDALDSAKKARNELAEALPGQTAALREAEENRDLQQRILEERQAELARTGERVRHALDIFQKTEEADREIRANEKALKMAEKSAASRQRELQDLEQQELNWREQEQELGSVPEKLAVLDRQEEAVNRLAADLAEAETIQKDVKAQEKKNSRVKKQYQEAGAAYQRAKAVYEDTRRAFLDTQAGILAMELKDGCPCPVCGSTDHPRPALPGYFHAAVSPSPGVVHRQYEADAAKTVRVDSDSRGRNEVEATEVLHEDPGSHGGKYADITRETLDALAREADDLAQKQQKLAADSQAGIQLLEVKEETLRRGLSKLQNALFPEMAQDMTLDQAARQISLQRQTLEDEKRDLVQKKDLLETVRRNLAGTEEKKQKLREQAERAKTAAADARARLEGSIQKRKALNQSVGFAAKEAAEHALSEAEGLKKRQEAVSRQAADLARAAKEKKDRAEALIKKYEQEIPAQQALCGRRQEAYAICMEQRNLTEREWQEITAKHAPEEEYELRDRIERHMREKTSAKSRVASAKETIAGRQRPDPEARKLELQEAERKLSEAESKFAQISEVCRADEHSRTALQSKLNERKRTLEEHARMDTLYRLVSGNVKDSRMDLETFVQRYYMEKILHAANRRFMEMSGGQFELRMVDAEKAGKGKNRGLDLMVYSTVTGKEREIRTLSGGESFMAALSLALGMSDQIQMSAASIHLDMMFIDEGFGSLDDHSRNQAVRVLQEMAGGKKLIGIISHVTELKQEIDDQLIVTRDEKGSHVRWQIS